MERAEIFDSFGGDERRVSGENDYLVISRQRFTRDHERVSSAPLVGLQHELHARARDSLAHALGFMADDYEDVVRRDDLGRHSNDMSQNRLATNFMEHLGMLRFKPGALARRHDRDRDSRRRG